MTSWFHLGLEAAVCDNAVYHELQVKGQIERLIVGTELHAQIFRLRVCECQRN